MKLLLPKKFI